MHTVNLCIVLLACTVMCSSAVIKDCKCITTRKFVNARITNVAVYDPRPYCNKREVIVTLKDKGLQCLDPNSIFTKYVLQEQAKRAARAMMNNSRPQTTTESANKATAKTVTLPSVSTTSPLSAWTNLTKQMVQY